MLSPYIFDVSRQHFLDRGHPLLDLFQAAHAQGEHALLLGLLPQLGGGGADHDHLADLLVELHDLEEADAALVAGVVALVAALGLEDLQGLGLLGSEADLDQRLGRDLGDGLAVGAQAADQPLGLDQAQRRGHQEGLDAHVDQAGDGRRGVVGVQGGEHQVAGQGGLDGDVGGLEVADLAHQDDVGVLAHEGAQGGREGQADLLLDVDLVDAEDVEFHRVFRGQDVHFLVVQLGDGRVEGVGLARAGRPRDQDDAPGLLDVALELLQRAGLEAELGQVELQLVLVQDADDDLLAVDGGQRGDAHVDDLLGRGGVDLGLDAAVLGQAPLGDVDAGDELEPGRDLVLQVHRRLHVLVQHAVDAQAHAEFLLVGLEMDVRRPLDDGVVEDEVDQLDGRGVLVDVPFRRDVVVLHLHDLDVGILAQLDLVEELLGLDAGGGAVILVDGLQDGRLGGDDRLDAQVGGEADLLLHEQVGRVGHGQGEVGADAVDGDDHVLAGDVGLDQLDHLLVDLELGEVDRRVAELLAQHLGDVLLGHVAEADQDAAQLARLLFLHLQRVLELLLRDLSFLK